MLIQDVEQRSDSGDNKAHKNQAPWLEVARRDAFIANNVRALPSIEVDEAPAPLLRRPAVDKGFRLLGFGENTVAATMAGIGIGRMESAHVLRGQAGLMSGRIAGNLAAVGASAFLNYQMDKHVFLNVKSGVGTILADNVAQPLAALSGLRPGHKTLVLTGLHFVGRLYDYSLSGDTDWDRNEKLNRHLFNDYFEQSKGSFDLAVSGSRLLYKTDPGLVSSRLNQRPFEFRSNEEHRSVAVMAAGAGEAILTCGARLCPGGKEFLFAPNLDLGANAAQHFNLTGASLWQVRQRIQQSEGGGIRTAEIDQVSQLIQEHVENHLAKIYGAHDLLGAGKAYDTVKAVVKTDLPGMESLAADLRRRIDRLNQANGNPRLTSKIGRDGALVNFGLAEYEHDHGNTIDAAGKFAAGCRLLEIAALKDTSRGAQQDVEQLQEIRKAVGARLKN